MDLDSSVRQLEAAHTEVQQICNRSLFSTLEAIAAAHRLGNAINEAQKVHGKAKIRDAVTDDLRSWLSDYGTLANAKIAPESLHTQKPDTVRELMALLKIP